MSATTTSRDLQELLSILRRRGIRLWPEGGKLRFRAAKGSLTPELKAELKERKEELLAHLLRVADRGADTPPQLVAEADVRAPLTLSQEQLFRLHQRLGQSSHYHENSALDLRGPLRLHDLQRACGHVVERHRVLRHRFFEADGTPTQEPIRRLALQMPHLDLDSLPPERRSAEVRRRLEQMVLLPLHIERGHLFRFLLLRLDSEHHVFFMVVHHLVVDGWSFGIFFDELKRFYDGEPVPPLALQFSDFARWQRRWFTGKRLEALLARGRRRLEGAQAPELPFDRPPGETFDPRGRHRPVELPPELVDGMRRLGEHNEATLFMVLLTGFAVLLARLSKRWDPLLGTPVSNRPSRAEGLIGYFVNILALRPRLEPKASFEEMLRRVRGEVLETFEHRELPFEALVDLPVRCALQNMPKTDPETADLHLSAREVPQQNTMVDLNLVLQEEGRRLRGRIEYRKSFDSTTIHQLFRQLRRLFEAAVKDPSRPVQTLDLLGPEERRQVAENAAPSPRTSAEPGEPEVLPTASTQRRLWFLDRLQPGNAAYSIPLVLLLEGTLNPEALEGALAALVRRHEALRTTFTDEGGEPRQVIAPAEAPPRSLPWVDLRHLGERAEAAGEDLARRDAARPFDLEKGPLLRTAVLVLDEHRHALLFNQHHSISDGWSISLMLRDFSALYTAAVAGLPTPEASPAPRQLRHFSQWQEKWLGSEDHRRQEAFWLERLRGAAVLELPTDRPRPQVPGWRGDTLNFSWPQELSQAVRRLGHRHSATPFMVLQALVTVLLHRLAGQDDLTLGTAIANRHRPGFDEIVGFLANTLVLRPRLSGDPSFAELLERIRLDSLDTFAHQDMPFDLLVDRLDLARNTRHTPLFQAMFTVQGQTGENAFELPGLRVQTPAVGAGTAKFDLSWIFAEDGDTFVGQVEYPTHLFDATTLKRWASHLRQLTEEAVAHPQISLSALPLLDAAQRHNLLLEVDDRAFDSPQQGTVHGALREQAEHRAEAIAVLTEEGHHWTYHHLLQRTWHLAQTLRSTDLQGTWHLGTPQESRIALLLPRGPQTLVAMLAILEIGCAYLPLDPDHPTERLRFMLEDGGARLLLTDTAHRERAEELVDGLDIPLQRVDDEKHVSATHVESPAGPDHLAYVMYTSGSTGRPKGVAVKHSNILRLVRGRHSPTASEDRMSHVSNLSFDAATWEIWGALLNGAPLTVLHRDTVLSPHHLAAAAARHRLTELCLTTSLFHQQMRWSPRLPPVTRMVAGGEAMHPEIARNVADSGGIHTLINGYGPTECTTFATWERVREDSVPETPAVPIGRAIAETTLYVVDRRARPVPQGVAGELWVGGGGLARGYLDRPALTAERFVPDPFTPLSGGRRLYRTGDRVRRRTEGRLEFLGRIDHQVKIRGFRVEPGEVRRRLLDHALVRQAEVQARPDSGGTLRLVAWVVPEGQPPEDLTERLRRHLSRSLPEYMVPAATAVLGALPLTPNGKVDRDALEDPEVERGSEPTESQAPQGDVEEHLARLFGEVLGLDSVGRGEDFFRLGGHSLLATRLYTRIQRDFPSRGGLPLRALFEEPTVAGLARRLRDRSTDAAGPGADLPFPTPKEGPAPLSFAQERLWFLDQLEPDQIAYNVPAALRLRGPLDRQNLAKTLTAIVARHDALRTTFDSKDGEPVQVVHPQALNALPIVELASVAEREEVLTQALRALVRRPFHLARGPLFRTVLFALDAQEHVLYLDLHHIVSDGWSMGVLAKELTALYGNDPHTALPPLQVQYPAFSRWQREWLQGEVLAQQLEFWRQRLTGLDPLELPTDRPRPKIQSYRGAYRALHMSPELGRGIETLASECGITPFTLLLAAFMTVLSRYSHQLDLTVGTPVANRPRPELEDLVGFFVNTLVIRGDLTGNPTATDFLERLRPAVLEALVHQDIPFERLVMELTDDRDPSRPPLFQVMLALENTPFESLHLGPLELEGVPLAGGTSKFDLTLSLSHTPEGFAGALEYNLDLFDAATAERLTRHLENLLAGLVEDPSRRLGELPLLTRAERHVLQVEGLRTGRFEAEAGHTLTERFLARRAQQGESIAWTLEGEHLSYDELHHQATNLAIALRHRGVQREDLVALCLPRDAHLPIPILGTLLAGAAYVPLDPAHPQERLATILEEAQVRTVVTSEAARAHLPESVQKPLLFEGRLAAPRTPEPLPSVRPHQLAYVIYTSGSTGRPKGVAITHHNVLRLFDATRSFYHFTGDDVWPLFHSYAFDVSVWEIWGALLHGGRLFGVPYLQSRSPEDFLGALKRERATVLNQTPSAFRQLSTALPEEPGTETTVRWIVFAGEALEFRTLRPWARHHPPPHPRLANMYGITETTVHVSFRRVDDNDIQNPHGSLVGPAMADLDFHLLDRHGRPVPFGVPGEIHVGGPGLARGYVGRPALTAQRFVPNPFGSRPGDRLYRSGDLARRRGDGEIETLGRIDHQVKVRGFRIELGEIEARLLEHPRVAEAVVLAPRLDGETAELVAYVVAQDPSEAELREHLRRGLPDYMQPAHLVFLEALPITPNGKVDRRALPSPSPRSKGGPRTLPRTPTEAALVEVFQEVLARREVGIEDNFFALGGHSLKVTQAVSRIHARLQVKLGLRELFAHPTPAGLAQAVAHRRREVLEPIPTTGDEGPHPLSHAQRRLWILARLVPNDITYNMAGALRLRGSLHREAFQQALRELVDRHQALRTSFPSANGEPSQRIAPPGTFEISLLPASEAEALEGARYLARKVFDLENGPLFEAQLYALAEDDHLFAFNMHHVVSDGWSLGVMERELAALYHLRLQGSEEKLPPLPMQYRDYAAWQNRWLENDASQSTRDFWRQTLAHPLPVLELPTDRPRPTVKTFRGRSLAIPLEEGDEPTLVGRLGALSLEHGTSLFMLLVGAVSALLQRWSGQRDLVLGSPVAGRDHPDLEQQIGFYVNTLPLRVQVAPEEPFTALLARVREGVGAALENASYPFDLLVEELGVDRDPARSPLFEVMVVLQNQESTGLDLEGVTAEGLGTDLPVSRFDLTFNFFEGPGGIALGLEYSSDLFDTTRILRLGQQLRRLLGALAEDSHSPLESLSTLEKAERHQLLVEWNDCQASYPRDETLHSRVATFAQIAPDRPALELDHAVLSYGELVRRARRLAHLLLANGLKPDEAVALYMERSLELVVAMLGVLEAGGCYLPLDPAYPDERLRYMADTAGVRQVLTLESLTEEMPLGDRQVLALDQQPDPLASSEDFLPPLGRSAPRGIAYLMYTSGSTGRPKGVRVPHRGVLRLVVNTNYAQMPEDARHMHIATIAFDASTIEIWGALANGATLTLFPPHLPSLEELTTFIAHQRLTHSLFTTSLFLEVVATDITSLRHLRVMSAGGDVMPTTTARAAREALPNTRLVNFYGPTEGSVAVTGYAFPAPARNIPSPVPIGRPLSNNHVALVDPHFRAVPLGVPGELCMGGDGLARDYNGRPAATAVRFVPDPFSGDFGGRLYRTGDLVTHLADGQMHFLGRIDHQVKVRGFRIEMGEIESHLREFEGLRDVVVLAPEVPGGGGRRLIAFFTTDGREPSKADLEQNLGERLPPHMVPSHFVQLEAIPLTPNRKFDRKQLVRQALELFARGQSGADHVEPQAGLERELATLWRETLAVAQVGVNDNFFDLGGHSLAAIRVHERMARELGLELPLVKLFEHPTLAGLARYLESRAPEASSPGARDRGARRRQALDRRRGRRR